MSLCTTCRLNWMPNDILESHTRGYLQWRIYIQKFPARAPPPQQDQIFSFLHTFSPKSTCVGGWRPLQRGLAPPHQQEILDPPLICVTYIVENVM